MGITYKLLPKIKDFIIEQKKKQPNLSCRKAKALIEKKFKAAVSKSSINSLFKQSGLSNPIGRTRKRRRSLIEAGGLGSILLKAIDQLLGGSILISEAIKNRAPNLADYSLLEGALYLPLFKTTDAGELGVDSGQAINSYVNDLQGVTALAPDILKVISDIFKEVWFIRVTFSDNSVQYLDGQLRTVWSTPHIPYDFSLTLCKSKSYIESYLQDNSPLILFTAPGYDIPTREFFDFMLAQEGSRNKIAKLTLYGNKMEELDSTRLSYDKKYFIFGLWPWQFEKYRVVDIYSGFNRTYFEPKQEDFYIADMNITLTQPKINQRVTLRGCALKRNLAGKVNLLIVTNIPQEKLTTEQLTKLYLNRWPNVEEGFMDYSRKIELFTYTGSSRKGFSTESLILKGKELPDIKGVLDYYLRGVDLYLRWYFLPAEYENLDFSTMKERFYDLGARIKAKKDFELVSFILPKGYSFQKDLAYACQRLNEKDIILPEGKRLWFTL